MPTKEQLDAMTKLLYPIGYNGDFDEVRAGDVRNQIISLTIQAIQAKALADISYLINIINEREIQRR